MDPFSQHSSDSRSFPCQPSCRVPQGLQDCQGCRASRSVPFVQDSLNCQSFRVAMTTRAASPGPGASRQALYGATARVAVLILLLSCFACLKGPRTIVLASKPFTESYIISHMAGLLLEQEGFTVMERFGVGSMIARQALLGNQIDIYPEYTGTAYTLYLNRSSDEIMSGERLYNVVRDLDQKNGIVWLDRTRVNNTYALAIRHQDKKRLGTSLSELADYNRRNPGKLVFGIDHEFYERPDGFKAMAGRYGMSLEPAQIRTMEIGLSFESIAREQIDVAMIYTTDGKLRKYNLYVLKDNLNFFPVYNSCYNVHESVLNEYPEIREILAPVAESLDNRDMQELNYRVDGLARPAFLVARDYLLEKELLR